MWYPENATKATITVLHKCELFLCLSYLSDFDLLRASTVCVWFRSAFFALTKGARDEHLNIANNNNECIFLSLESLVIHRKLVQKVYNLNFGYKFPRLAKLVLQYTDINITLFPKIESLTKLTWSKSRQYRNNSKENDQTSIADIFPNLKVLIINYGSILTVSKGTFAKLERLVLKGQIVGDCVPPSLRELYISDQAFPEELVNRATGLQLLRINHGDLPPSPISCLIQLEICELHLHERLLPNLARLFPNLRRLSLLFYAKQSEVNLRAMSPHRKLETLMLECYPEAGVNDVNGLEQLSHLNFPCLSVILSSARNFDLIALKPNPCLEKLVVAPGTKVNFQPPLGMSFPKLEIIRWKDVVFEKYSRFTKLEIF
jgi:hypothetical protein